MKNFKIGDKVKCIERYCGNESIIGQKGKIIVLMSQNSHHDYGIEFENKIYHGHNCDGVGREGYCWFIPESLLVLIEKKPIKEFGIVKFMRETERRMK